MSHTRNDVVAAVVIVAMASRLLLVLVPLDDDSDDDDDDDGIDRQCTSLIGPIKNWSSRDNVATIDILR